MLGVYNLPTPIGFSYTRTLGLKHDRVFLKRGHLFLNAVMFLKKTVIFFGVYDVCRKYPVYHTPLFIVNLQHVFAVYEMQVVSGNPLYIRARV